MARLKRNGSPCRSWNWKCQSKGLSEGLEGLKVGLFRHSPRLRSRPVRRASRRAAVCVVITVIFAPAMVGLGLETLGVLPQGLHGLGILENDGHDLTHTEICSFLRVNSRLRIGSPQSPCPRRVCPASPHLTLSSSP